jgi:hypothetical protein
MSAGRSASTILALVLAIVVALWWWTNRPPLLEREGIETEHPVQLPSTVGERDTRIGEAERVVVEATAIELEAVDPAMRETRARPFTVPTEPGVLEVEVWLADHPLPGVDVWVAPCNQVGFWDEDADLGHPDIRRGVTDEKGLVRLFPVSPSNACYSVWVREGEIDTFAVVDAPERDRQGWRVLIRLGTSGIEGRVFHDDGSPWPERLVMVNVMPENSNSCGGRARTDASGAYRIGFLPASSVIVVLQSDGMQALREANVTLADQEWKRVDFGSDRPKAHWTGRLTTLVGAPLEAALHVRLEDVERGNVFPMLTLADGTFAIDLVPGRYRASGNLFRGLRVIGEFQIEGTFIDRNLPLPDAAIQGRLTYVGSRTDEDLPARTAQVWLSSRNEPHLRDQAGRDGPRYSFLGVEPGEYRLTTFPRALVGGDAEGIPVVVTAVRSVIDLDLTIQDP